MEQRETLSTREFTDEGSKFLSGLMKGCDRTLKCVEALTVFLKDEETLCVAENIQYL
jgi:hypothetical protein